MVYSLAMKGKILEFVRENYRKIMPKSSKTRHKNMQPVKQKFD